MYVVVLGTLWWGSNCPALQYSEFSTIDTNRLLEIQWMKGTMCDMSDSLAQRVQQVQRMFGWLFWYEAM